MPLIGSFYSFFTEFFLGIFSILLTIASLFLKKGKEKKFFIALQFILFILLISLFSSPLHTATYWFNNFFITDCFSIFSKGIFLSFSFIFFWLTRSSIERKVALKLELIPLFIFSLVGLCLMISSYDLISLFISLEIHSLTLYVLISMNSETIFSCESSIKYFILGALASGIFLYGASLVYGSVGSTNFSMIEKYLNTPPSVLFSIGAILIILSLAFKLSLAPFHLWAPDVYEGSDLVVLTFMATISKISIFFVLIRLLSDPFYNLQSLWQGVFILLSSLSMVWGGLAALNQINIKRFLAYSSIGHMGFLILSFLSIERITITYGIIYALFYIFSGLGFFSCIFYLKQMGLEIKIIEDLKYVRKTSLFIALIFGFLILSLAGFPPLPGFFPKLLIFKLVIARKSYTLLSLLTIYLILSASYSLILVKKIFIDYDDFSKASLPLSLKRPSPFIKFLLFLIVSSLVIMLIYFDKIINFVQMTLSFSVF